MVQPPMIKNVNFSGEELDAYENSLKYYRDLKNVIDTAKQEGIAQGKKQVQEQLLNLQ